MPSGASSPLPPKSSSSDLNMLSELDLNLDLNRRFKRQTDNSGAVCHSETEETCYATSARSSVTRSSIA